MPLEFAPRPRFNLERPLPRRRSGWLRLPPFALPIGAYWLVLAGATHALLRSAAAEEPPGARQLGSASSEWVDEPASEALEAPDSRSAVPADTGEPALPAPASAEPWGASGPLQREPRADADSVTLLRAPAGDALPARRAPMGDALPAPRAPVGDAMPAPRAPVGDAMPARRALADRGERGPRAVSPTPAFPAGLAEESATRAAEAASSTTERDAPSRSSLPSCESAAAAANQQIDLRAGRGAPDLTRDAFAAVLENGAYLTHCAISGRMAVEICAAVQHGRVIGVSVTTEPGDSAVNACVRRAVVGLSFPRSSQIDVTRTRFAPSL